MLGPLVGSVLAAALSACTSSQLPVLPSLASPDPAAPTADAGGTAKATTPPVSLGSPTPPAAKPDVAAGPGQITAVRGATLMLYASATGVDGQRVPASTFSLPLPVAGRAGSRLAIETVEGVRWIAAADVTYVGPSPATKSRP